MRKSALVLIIPAMFFLSLAGCVSQPEYLVMPAQVATIQYDDLACYRGSEELVKRYRESGYFAFQQTVDGEAVPDEYLHEIVILMLPIEATTGQIITPEQWEELGLEFFPSSLGDEYGCDFKEDSWWD